MGVEDVIVVAGVSAGACSTCGIVVLSTGPRRADLGSCSSSVPGGCTGSYSSVASCPLQHVRSNIRRPPSLFFLRKL